MSEEQRPLGAGQCLRRHSSRLLRGLRKRHCPLHLESQLAGPLERTSKTQHWPRLAREQAHHRAGQQLGKPPPAPPRKLPAGKHMGKTACHPRGSPARKALPKEAPVRGDSVAVVVFAAALVVLLVFVAVVAVIVAEVVVVVVVVVVVAAAALVVIGVVVVVAALVAVVPLLRLLLRQ